MLAVFIMPTPGRRNVFNNSQNANVWIAILLIMDVKTCWNSALECLEWVSWLEVFTWQWLLGSKSRDCRSLFTTQDEWTIVKYIMVDLRSFRYWTLSMSMRFMVTVHHVITFNNDMFAHINGVSWALAMKKTQWKEDLFSIMKLARLQMSKCYAKVTPTTDVLLISAYILDPFCDLWSFRK